MSASRRLQQLEGLDIGSLTPGQVAGALRDIAVVRGTTDRLEGALARRLAELNERGASTPPSDALGRGGRVSRGAAERAERRGHTLGEVPQMNDALGAGKIGTEHVDALAGAARHLDDAARAALFARDRELTELAATYSPSRFGREVRGIVDEITDDDGLGRAERQAEAATLASGRDTRTGMIWLRAELAPEDGNRVRRRIDAEAAALAKRPEHDRLRRDQLEAMALVNLVAGAQAAGGRPVPADVAVLIDYDKLVNRAITAGVAEFSDGSPVPADTARRFACDANIIPVVLGGDGMPLDVGRARRLATPSQRRALRAMYRTCAVHGCDHGFDRCHIHHLLEWDDDGFTDLDNLLPLCSFHHHRAHEGRWRMQLDASTRRLTVWLPDGTLHSRSVPDAMHERTATRTAA